MRAVERYLGRISGPLLERIDIHQEMAAVPIGSLLATRPAEDSATVHGRVLAARERQGARFGASGRVLCNAEMGLAELRVHCRLERKVLGFLRMAVGRLGLSPRAYHRSLRLARTIADLEGAEEIGEKAVAEAIAYRVLDRGFGGMGGGRSHAGFGERCGAGGLGGS